VCFVFEGVFEVSWYGGGEVFWGGEGWEQGLFEVCWGGEEGEGYGEGFSAVNVMRRVSHKVNK